MRNHDEHQTVASVAVFRVWESSSMKPFAEAHYYRSITQNLKLG